MAGAENEGRKQGIDGFLLADWRYGKLPTGPVMEELLRRNALDGRGSDGVFSRSAYDRIRQILDRDA